MHKAILWLDRAQLSWHNRQQFLLLTGLVLSAQESCKTNTLGIFLKDGRRGPVVQWPIPLYCSLLCLAYLPHTSLNFNGT